MKGQSGFHIPGMVDVSRLKLNFDDLSALDRYYYTEINMRGG